MARITKILANDDGWSDWINGKLLLRARRNNRSTALVRRHQRITVRDHG